MKKTLLVTLLFAALCSFASADFYSLYDPSYIYVKDEKNEGNIKWKDTVSAGISFDRVKGTYIPEKLNGKVNTKKLEYAKVEYKGKEAYILKSGLVESNGEVGVIKCDTLIYTWNNRSSFENAILKAGTLVVVENSLDSDTKLHKITFYDDIVFWKMRSVYIDYEAVSINKDDCEAVKLAKLAKTKDAETEREIITKLLSTAEKKAKSSEISEFVAKISEEINGKDITQSPTAECSLGGSVNSGGAKVNVRSTPGKSGSVVGQIEDGTIVRASKKTVQEESIGGETAAWYYISTEGSEPTEGWVFGSTVSWED